jgi:hypothetical protein
MQGTGRLANLKVGRYDLESVFGGSRPSGYAVAAEAGLFALVTALFEVI